MSNIILTNCQVVGVMCPPEDLCTRCKGTGEEPLTPDGSDPCCHCDHCFDEVMGWSTGIEPGTKTMKLVRGL